VARRRIDQEFSSTAGYTCFSRACANCEKEECFRGPDDLAKVFLPAPARGILHVPLLRRFIFRRIAPSGIYEYVMARTRLLDESFVSALEDGFPQIVLLGAGYDTRAYRFAALNNTTRIIELDIATTQNRKEKCLKKAQIDIPEHVKLVPIDFDKESLKNVLEKAGYENNEKTLFLWEGVSYYLDPGSVDATLEFVNHSSHNESLIAFDYAISISEENTNHYYGVKEVSQTWRKYRSNELFRFAIDEGKTESYFEQRGLRIVDHLDNREIEKAFLLNENGSLIGQINGLFRFVSASPISRSQKKQGT